VSAWVARPMPDVPAPPVELSVRDEGTGPAVLLVHGVGGNRTVWNDVIPRLSSSFRLLAPDLRGHGVSPHPPESTYDLPELIGDLLRLLDAKGVASAHWVGLSGGALLALRAALDAPARVRSLTMVSGAAYTDAHTRSIVDRWVETYTKEGADRFALRLLKDLYYPDWIEAHLDFADEVRRTARHQDFGPARKWGVHLAQFDERARIGTVSCPVLLIQGLDDQVTDASHARILRQSIVHAQMRLFPQTGHMVPYERPQETADAIAAFARSVESATPVRGVG
jgi:pimeloyl-ACP methyl ester carboxylesterase